MLFKSYARVIRVNLWEKEREGGGGGGEEKALDKQNMGESSFLREIVI